MKISLFSGWLVATATVLNAESCDPLADKELLVAVLSYEAERSLVPPEYAFGVAVEFVEANPDCCTIQRENHPFTPKPSWFNWLFEYDSIYITIGLPPLEAAAADPYILQYLTTPCGVVGERFAPHQ